MVIKNSRVCVSGVACAYDGGMHVLVYWPHSHTKGQPSNPIHKILFIYYYYYYYYISQIQLFCYHYNIYVNKRLNIVINIINNHLL